MFVKALYSRLLRFFLHHRLTLLVPGTTTHALVILGSKLHEENQFLLYILGSDRVVLAHN